MKNYIFFPCFILTIIILNIIFGHGILLCLLGIVFLFFKFATLNEFNYKFGYLSKEGYRHYPIIWFAKGIDGASICILGLTFTFKIKYP